MFDDHLYNMMNQLIQEHKSLWRIKGQYLSDADQCEDCTEVWNRVAESKERNIAEMTEIVRKHLNGE